MERSSATITATWNRGYGAWDQGGDETPAGPCLAARIQRHLHELDSHVPTLREVASALAMSPRTLRRRLKAEGASYSGILRNERVHLAAGWLKETSLTVDIIAERLGYTEVTNFRRAFRRWVGCSPHAFRQVTRQASSTALSQAA